MAVGICQHTLLLACCIPGAGGCSHRRTGTCHCLPASAPTQCVHSCASASRHHSRRHRGRGEQMHLAATCAQPSTLGLVACGCRMYHRHHALRTQLLQDQSPASLHTTLRPGPARIVSCASQPTTTSQARAVLTQLTRGSPDMTWGDPAHLLTECEGVGLQCCDLLGCKPAKQHRLPWLDIFVSDLGLDAPLQREHGATSHLHTGALQLGPTQVTLQAPGAAHTSGKQHKAPIRLSWSPTRTLAA